jgi:hypothetical protein
MQVIGGAAALVGVALIVYAKHSMNKVNEAKGFVDKFNNFFSHNPGVWNPLIKFFGGKAQEEVSKYDPILTFLFYLGIALVILGIWGIFWFRRRI